MSKKEITSSHLSSKKLRTKELIYAGAFGALYIVLMLVIVLGTSMIPVLYLLAPITVGLVCGTVYMLCVLKVKKFGAALILGILFALCACSNAWFSFVGAVAAALLAEVIIKLGNYKSKKMYLLSFVVFNINMACPYMMLSFTRDSFLKRSVEYYAQEYADGIAKLAPSWVFLPILGFALVGRFLNDKQRQQQCYMVMQDVNRQLFSDSVIEEVMLNAAVSEEEAQTILAELVLAEYADRHPASLSGGQKQRIAIAAALCAGKVLKTNFPDGGILIAEQNCKAMQKNEKHHDTVKNTKAHFMSGTDSEQEIADLTSGFQLVEEHSFNEEMKKYSIRGKLFALLLPKMNDRWATFRW